MTGAETIHYAVCIDTMEATDAREFPESHSLCLSNEELYAQWIGRAILMRFAYILRHQPYIIGYF